MAHKTSTSSSTQFANLQAHEGHAVHSSRTYWIVAAILTILTAMEVTLFVINEGGVIAKWLEITILLVLSFLKGILVVAIFMHMRGDANIFKFLFIAPFIMATSMMLIFLVIFSGHVGIAG